MSVFLYGFMNERVVNSSCLFYTYSKEAGVSARNSSQGLMCLTLTCLFCTVIPKRVFRLSPA